MKIYGVTDLFLLLFYWASKAFVDGKKSIEWRWRQCVALGGKVALVPEMNKEKTS